jgi:hypothetical protein
MDNLALNKGEVVGERQLARERAARRAQVNIAVAAMSLITILAVMVTIFLLREPGPAGPPGPVPFMAQFVSDDAGCIYRVLYKTHEGLVITVDARAQAANCHG